MSDTKEVSILDEENRIYTNHIQSDLEQKLTSSLIQKFRDTADVRNRAYQNFDNLTLTEYIDDSVRRFTTNVDEREGLDDWQARVFDPMTRSKAYTIIGNAVKNLPIAEARARGEEDYRRAQILTNLYEYSEEQDDYEDLMVRAVMEAVVKGTAIVYEGHERKETSIRDIVSGDADDIKIKESTKVTNKLYGKIVRLEDFYPSSVGVFSIKEMPFCFWREIIPYHQFLHDYAMYSRSKKVQPQRNPQIFVDQVPEYLDYISNDVGDGDVEILRYYNKETDEFVMMANGIWLNPLMIDDKEVVSPIPFSHKELPFFDIKNELLDATFFYGKSLPDKLKSMQDVLNVLTNMLLDQSFLTVFKPLLTNGFDSIEDDYLRPGRRTPIDTQGLSISEAVKEVDISTPTGWHQYILEYTRKIIEEASVDKTTQGIAGVGERTTAQEIRAASEGVESLLGIFSRFIKNGILRKAQLRIKNIMQFYTDPDNPIVEMVGGEGATRKFNKAFNVFKFDSAVMSNGKRGTKVIELYRNGKELPSKGDLRARSDFFKLDTGKEIEIIALPGKYIRNVDVDIRLVANPKSDETRDMEKAMHLEKVKIYKSFFPNLIDDAELAAQTMEKLGDDPSLLLNENILNQPDEGAMKSQQESPLSTQPSANLQDNLARGARGGEQPLNDMQLT